MQGRNENTVKNRFMSILRTLKPFMKNKDLENIDMLLDAFMEKEKKIQNTKTNNNEIIPEVPLTPLIENLIEIEKSVITFNKKLFKPTFSSKYPKKCFKETNSPPLKVENEYRKNNKTFDLKNFILPNIYNMKHYHFEDDLIKNTKLLKEKKNSQQLNCVSISKNDFQNENNHAYIENESQQQIYSLFNPMNFRTNNDELMMNNFAINQQSFNIHQNMLKTQTYATNPPFQNYNCFYQFGIASSLKKPHF